MLYSRHWRDRTCWKLMVKLPNGHSTCWCVWLLEYMEMISTLLLRYICGKHIICSENKVFFNVLWMTTWTVFCRFNVKIVWYNKLICCHMNNKYISGARIVYIVAYFTTPWYHCAAISWFWKWPVTQVYGVLGRITWRWADRAVTSHRDSSRHARRGKERVVWLVSWPTQMTNRRGQSQWMDCGDVMISSRNFTRYHDTNNSHNSSPNTFLCHSNLKTLT